MALHFANAPPNAESFLEIGPPRVCFTVPEWGIWSSLTGGG